MDLAASQTLLSFLQHLSAERRLSPLTCEAYARDLRRLELFCGRHALGHWGDLDSAHVRAFAAETHRRGASPGSIRRALSAVRTFYFYLMREGRVTRNPAVGVGAPRSRRKVPRVLDVDRVAGLLDIAGEDPVVIRDRAIMELFYSSGLRLAELVGLDLSDLALAQGLVSVTGKGRKARVLPVGRLACVALACWLRVRPAMAKHETALFVSRRGRRISRRAVQARLHHWGRAQAVPGSLHPHMLRHAFASHLLESSGDLRAVQELLGHAQITTTQIYTHIDFQHSAEVYDQAHPRARKKKPVRSTEGK